MIVRATFDIEMPEDLHGEDIENQLKELKIGQLCGWEIIQKEED